MLKHNLSKSSTFLCHVSGQMELFLKGQDAINDDLPGEDPEVVAEAIDGEAGPLNGMYLVPSCCLGHVQSISAVWESSVQGCRNVAFPFFFLFTRCSILPSFSNACTWQPIYVLH